MAAAEGEGEVATEYEGEFVTDDGPVGDASPAAAPDSPQGMQGTAAVSQIHSPSASFATGNNNSHSASTTATPPTPATTTGNDTLSSNNTAEERHWGLSARGPLKLGEGTRRGLTGPGKRAVELVQQLAWRRVLGPSAVGLGMAAVVERAFGSADVAKVLPHACEALALATGAFAGG